MQEIDSKFIDLIHSCYIENFRFINGVKMDFPFAEIEFNLDHRYYTPDDRGGLSAANFIILFNQSFLCFLYGLIQGRQSHVLNVLDLDVTNRVIADNVKMMKMDGVKYRRFISSDLNLHAKLSLRKIIDRKKSAGLVYFLVDFDACDGCYVGTFTLALKV
ncbi:MAG: hypothetical protein KAS93_05690 [Gammaproteobacteria bacterium]|nr:hypothetical protein [Gammaproteobacteria bacterium]